MAAPGGAARSSSRARWRNSGEIGAVDEARGFPLGILLYPLSVLLLILVFHARLDIVAAAWGILACGDGAARGPDESEPLRPGEDPGAAVGDRPTRRLLVAARRTLIAQPAILAAASRNCADRFSNGANRSLM